MIQRFLIGIGALNLLAVIFLSAHIFFFQEKIVYVDSAKLLDNYKGMQHARAVYQQKAATWKANVDTLTVALQKQIFHYEKSNASLSAGERKLTQELIRTKQKQLYDYQQATDTQAQQEDAKMTSEVVALVNTYIRKYGQDHGYKIILAATQYGNLAYAEDQLDITNEVLEGLNTEYEGQ